jgi:hypothetical protein
MQEKKVGDIPKLAEPWLNIHKEVGIVLTELDKVIKNSSPQEVRTLLKARKMMEQLQVEIFETALETFSITIKTE